MCHTKKNPRSASTASDERPCLYTPLSTRPHTDVLCLGSLASGDGKVPQLEETRIRVVGETHKEQEKKKKSGQTGQTSLTKRESGEPGQASGVTPQW
jgi:hypothetical protein